MRIVLACDLYWPAINGIATFTRNLAKGLSARGHEVLVIAPSQDGKKFVETDDNYQIARTTSIPFPFFPNYRMVLNPQPEVKKIITDFKPDLVHIQTPLGLGLAARNSARKLNIPVVATNHAMPENVQDNLKQMRLMAPFAEPLASLVKEYGLRFHSNVDYITMPTQAAVKMFLDEKEFKMPLEAVSNGIDLSRFSPGEVKAQFKSYFGIPKNKPIILYVGRVDGEKHISTLVRAMPKVLAEIDAHLVIVGHGNDAENLRELIREFDLLSNVTMTGRVDDEDLAPLYRCGTVFVMPSPAELQCLTLLEAMATGLPSVAVNAGALHELCQDGLNGYLCKPDDSKSMSTKIIAILKDEKLQSNMGVQALRIAKTHDLEFTLTRFEEIYAEVLKNYKPRKPFSAKLRSFVSS
ncbi:MAG TPA: glycosyltransferase [Candidatus Saccharimonadales bacterium]|nr:glycosyltransferase [Candidatus Saccharimonadales bacterium]